MFGINQWELLVVVGFLFGSLIGAGLILFWIVRAAVRSANRDRPQFDPSDVQPPTV